MHDIDIILLLVEVYCISRIVYYLLSYYNMDSSDSSIYIENLKWKSSTNDFNFGMPCGVNICNETKVSFKIFIRGGILGRRDPYIK